MIQVASGSGLEDAGLVDRSPSQRQTSAAFRVPRVRDGPRFVVVAQEVSPSSMVESRPIFWIVRKTAAVLMFDTE